MQKHPIKIPLIKSIFYKEQETNQALCDFILKPKKLSIGEQCADFEKEFALGKEKNIALYLTAAV